VVTAPQPLRLADAGQGRCRGARAGGDSLHAARVREPLCALLRVRVPRQAAKGLRQIRAATEPFGYQLRAITKTHFATRLVVASSLVRGATDYALIRDDLCSSAAAFTARRPCADVRVLRMPRPARIRRQATMNPPSNHARVVPFDAKAMAVCAAPPITRYGCWELYRYELHPYCESTCSLATPTPWQLTPSAVLAPEISEPLS
jgi:hypothetical protein